MQKRDPLEDLLDDDAETTSLGFGVRAPGHRYRALYLSPLGMRLLLRLLWAEAAKVADEAETKNLQDGARTFEDDHCARGPLLHRCGRTFAPAGRVTR